MKENDINPLKIALESALLVQARKNRDYKLLNQINSHFKEENHKAFFSTTLSDKNREFEINYLSKLKIFIDFLSDDDCVFYNKEIQTNKNSLLVSLKNAYEILKNESEKTGNGTLYLLKSHGTANLAKNLREIDDVRKKSLDKYNSFYSHAKYVL